MRLPNKIFPFGDIFIWKFLRDGSRTRKGSGKQLFSRGRKAARLGRALENRRFPKSSILPLRLPHVERDTIVSSEDRCVPDLTLLQVEDVVPYAERKVTGPNQERHNMWCFYIVLDPPEAERELLRILARYFLVLGITLEQ